MHYNNIMSCLYNSLARLHHGMNASQLRQTLCDYLLTNPILGSMHAADSIKYDNNNMDISLRDYVNRMRNNSEWGGAIEIKAYCDLYNRNVTVRSIPNNKNIEFISENKATVLDKIYWTGNHYEPVSSTLIQIWNL